LLQSRTKIKTEKERNNTKWLKNYQLLNWFIDYLFASLFPDARSEISARNAKYFLAIFEFFSTAVVEIEYVIIRHMFFVVF